MTEIGIESYEWSRRCGFDAQIPAAAPVRVAHHTLTVIGSRILVIGGWDDNRPQSDVFVIQSGICHLQVTF